MHSGRGHKRKVDLRFEFPKSFVFQQSFVVFFVSNKFCVVFYVLCFRQVLCRVFCVFVSKKVDVSKELVHNFT